MKIIDGGVTAPKGYCATGKHIGIKKVKKDLTLLLSETECVAAGAFTKNIVKAAPVLWDEKIVTSGEKVRGILVNSGNANACTGEQGIKDNETMAKTFATLASVSAEKILVCSTGVIGVNLPIEKIVEGIKDTYTYLGSSLENGNDAAEGIITTDTFVKQIAVTFELNGKEITIGGMAKGSGMIHPNMATMLSFITTDANISYHMLNKALKESVVDSYNMISVDGDTSTNDTVLTLANGMAGNDLIDKEDEAFTKFKETLHFVNLKLAKDIIHDGEGATKFVEVFVKRAKTKNDARTIAKSVISSSLFKTAIFGEDANWGRILAAMGYSGAEFNPQLVTIHYISSKGRIILMEAGTPIKFDEIKALEILKEKEITVEIELNQGVEEATAWGCDLSYEYVRINGEYRS